MAIAKKFSLGQLAELTKVKLTGDPDYIISGVEALDSASPKDASFLANSRYRSAMTNSKAGVICIDPSTPLVKDKNFLISEDPSRSFQIIVEALLFSKYNNSGFTGIHPTAVVHSGAKIGNDCVIHSHVVVRERCVIGNRVILQPGSVIGSCGFGYTTDAQGRHTKLEQLGYVIIEDDVEIGANTTIDRARFKSTCISRGTKIDNLVQIGHNVTLGQDNIIVSQSGIAGSVKTGRNVVLGGQAGVVGHLEIADYVMIATRGGVSKSINKPGKYAGGPVMSLAEYNRQQVYLRKISDYVKQIEALERRVKELEDPLSL